MLAATSGYAAGVVSIETLAGLRRLPVEVVKEELETAGIRPPDLTHPWSSHHDLPAVAVDLSELEDEGAEGAEE